MTDRHVAYPTHDLPLDTLGAAGELVAAAVEERLLPELAARFGLVRGRLSTKEIFLAKYSAVKGGLAALEEHEDGSDFSFVLALNDEAAYSGGVPSYGHYCHICGTWKHNVRRVV